MSAIALFSSELRCMSTKRYCAYILISASAAGCYYIVSTLALMLTSVSNGLPLLVGYRAYTFQHQFRPQRSLQYCVLLSAALLSLGDAAHLIQVCFVADPNLMTSVHLAIVHFCLAFLVISETEYFARTERIMRYPDVWMTLTANLIASYHPNSLICRHCRLSEGQKPPAATFWRALALDATVSVMWHYGMLWFTSLLQAWIRTCKLRLELIIDRSRTGWGSKLHRRVGWWLDACCRLF